MQKSIKRTACFCEFKKLQAETADAKEAWAWARTKLDEQAKRIKRLELDLLQTEAEQRQAQAQLFSDSGQTSKELEQLGRRSHALDCERREKEDMLLLAMEGQENLTQTVQQAEEHYRALRAKLRQLQKAGNAEIQSIKNRVNDLELQREQLQKQISEALLGEYRRQRPRYKGKPLAHLENDCCSGCRVIVFTGLKSRLKQPDSKVYAENCGRPFGTITANGKNPFCYRLFDIEMLN